MNRFIHRVTAAGLTVPRLRDWLEAIALLFIFALIYVPIGFKLEFLKVAIQPSWLTILGVAAGSFLMPGVSEEVVFRGLLIPHSSEMMTPRVRGFWIGLSWLLFVAYHLHPFTPAFFREPAFLFGAGLLGLLCTISYLKSHSLWTPVVIHWIIVVVWLVGLGGLEKFSQPK